MTTKEKISATASRLFHEKGFSATSVREIAGSVGIEAASLYNHINSKTDLLDHICFDTAHRFESHLDEVEKGGGSPIDMIKAILNFHIDMAIHDPKVLTVFSQEWRHLPVTRRMEFQKQRKSYEMRLNKIVETGQENGQLDRDLDAEILVKMLISSIQWVYFLKPETALAHEKRLRRTVELFIENSVNKLTGVS
ncbi:MAG: TetR/AcrR family transcriptional regulator [Saprospiraceae bacterium]|nr:TetR/AcrR family transcriptional regulator [Saprospiraceae bacterium]